MEISRSEGTAPGHETRRVPVPRQRVRVAFIAGAARSGSTLLERILQQVEGVLTVGELRWLWSERWPSMVCTCGEEFRACEFWQAVLLEAFGFDHETARLRVRSLSSSVVRHRSLPAFAMARYAGKSRPEFAELSSHLEHMYRAIAHVGGATTVVDATKSPLWGIAASGSEAIDVRVVHLVRDPRAVAFSWTRTPELPSMPGQAMSVHGPMKATFDWLVANTATEILKWQVPKSTLLLYEELARNPRAATASIGDALGLAIDPVTLFTNHTLVAGEMGHAIAGNPMRVHQGPIVISTDEEWRTASLRRARFIALLCAGPLWIRYQHLAVRNTNSSAFSDVRRSKRLSTWRRRDDRRPESDYARKSRSDTSC